MFDILTLGSQLLKFENQIAQKWNLSIPLEYIWLHNVFSTFKSPKISCVDFLKGK